MEMPGQLTVWGVRGSFPVAERPFLDYGGNTSCLSLDLEDGTVILDAGSGLDRLGKELFRRQIKRMDILLSHVHLDHVMGLVTFQPLFDAETEIHIYGEARAGLSLHSQLETLMGPPYWPLKLSKVRARVLFHEIGPGTCFRAAGTSVATLRSCHPDKSLIYRLDFGGRSLVYTLDCELAGDMFDRLADFARRTSLIVWDSSFAPGDLRPGWGHSTWELGLALRRAAEAEQILMSHYDRSYSDEFLRGQEQLARQADSACRFAREGMVIQL